MLISADSRDPSRLVARRLTLTEAGERERLIGLYEREVYRPAFPDAAIREDPRYWLDLLAAEPPAPPPQPLIDVVLLCDGRDKVVAGVTVEYYRTAGCGLLTYMAVASEWRGLGVGRQLVGFARQALDAMAGSAVLMFAETERWEDAANDDERTATRLRQKQLAGLGCRWVEFDYVMPALRPDSAPHRLHLMLFDPSGSVRAVASAKVAGLLRELAAALGADLAASEDTSAMITRLDAGEKLPVIALPAVAAHGG